MTKNLLRNAAPAVAAAALLLVPAVGWADASPVLEVKQVAATAVLYRGPQVKVAISYRSPKLNPGSDWIMLDAAMTATRDPVEIPRNAVSVRTPDGQVVPLAPYRAYSTDYSQLAPAILQDNAVREPLGYLPPQRFRRLDYFPPHGVGLAWDSVWLDNWHNNYGRLFFQLPGPVQKGTYELLIHLSESEVAIPFTL